MFTIELDLGSPHGKLTGSCAGRMGCEERAGLDSIVDRTGGCRPFRNVNAFQNSHFRRKGSDCWRKRTDLSSFCNRNVGMLVLESY
jgi:hypothetical protein